MIIIATNNNYIIIVKISIKFFLISRKTKSTLPISTRQSAFIFIYDIFYTVSCRFFWLRIRQRHSDVSAGRRA